MNNHDPVVIVSAARTPMGGFQGAFSDTSASELGSSAIEQTLMQSGLQKTQVQEVIMGCVLAAGQGQAPARQAALGAGLSINTSCTTINKMCGSGMQAVMFAHDALTAKSTDFIIAGGMENMTLAPYLMPKIRGGLRMGHAEVVDHMFLDGLEDAYDKGRLMGTFAEETATHYQFTREAQDTFAIESLNRAKQAIDNGSFNSEVVPVTLETRKGQITVAQDEQPHNANIEKIPTLRPAFAKDGTVTAANASSISDGAAALLMTRLSVAEKQGLKPLAKIIGQSRHAHEPQWFTTAPIHAIQSLLQQLNYAVNDIDLFEINEAFAVVTMAAMKELDIPHDKVNVHGGACALGHPIGASGARILVTLINALKQKDQRTGIGSLCIGGGEAVAVAIELID